MDIPVRRWRLAVLAVAALSTSACGAEAIVAPIIILTNTWAEEGNPGHTFQFVDDTGGTSASEGTFTGTERLPDGVTEYDYDNVATCSRGPSQRGP